MGFFHTPKPNKFRVEPRFWDPEKEKREARERRIKAELGLTEGEYKAGINRGDFRKGISDGKWEARAVRRRSNMRLGVIFLLLIAALWFILYF